MRKRGKVPMVMLQSPGQSLGQWMPGFNACHMGCQMRRCPNLEIQTNTTSIQYTYCWQEYLRIAYHHHSSWRILNLSPSKGWMKHVRTSIVPLSHSCPSLVHCSTAEVPCESEPPPHQQSPENRNTQVMHSAQINSKKPMFGYKWCMIIYIFQILPVNLNCLKLQGTGRSQSAKKCS